MNKKIFVGMATPYISGSEVSFRIIPITKDKRLEKMSDFLSAYTITNWGMLNKEFNVVGEGSSPKFDNKTVLVSFIKKKDDITIVNILDIDDVPNYGQSERLWHYMYKASEKYELYKSK